MNPTVEPGVLYVVATPIGNLADISARALAVLGEVDAIAAEDTRYSKRLLGHYGICTPLISLHEHNESARVAQLLAMLRAGKALALVSDAGTPLISDPGFRLLRELREAGLRAIPIPGPSSVTAALCVAGLPIDRFAFEGFLPAKAEARRKHLQTLEDSPYTLVFFEAGRRAQASLADMAAIFGAERRALIARELTKAFEESRLGSLQALQQWLGAAPQRCRGEFVLVVQGAGPAASGMTASVDVERLLRSLLQELPLKRAVRIAVQASGLRKNTLYELALRLSAEGPYQ